MAVISAGLVKDLREKTGVGMMECKKALEENNGDIDASIKWLRERGMAKAAKKAGRIAAEGIVEVAFSPDGKTGAVIELNCETDFSARNEAFTQFASSLGKVAISGKYQDLDQLNKAPMNGKTVDESLKEMIAKVGENMSIRRFQLANCPQGGVFGYNHLGGKIGCLVVLEGVNPADSKAQELGKELAMHVAAAAPRYLTRDEVSQEEVDQERDIARTKLEQEGKAADMIDKILSGHVNKFYKEICLIDQAYTRDPKLTIDQVVKASGLGAKLIAFYRFALGEGIEKKKENFAEEVAAQSRLS
ncbi:MAG: elongation factor Ts [Oligoflexales bacterium]|nr:elongation factor Ts [Oligoflexales bacterium]